MLNKSIKNADDFDALHNIIDDTEFWDIFEEGSENLKATRKSLKHVDDIRKSQILREIKAEIESTDDLLKKASQRPRIDKLNKHIEELKDFRKEFMGMDPKNFKMIEDFT